MPFNMTLKLVNCLDLSVINLVQPKISKLLTKEVSVAIFIL